MLDQLEPINNPLIPPPPEGQRTPITAGKDIPISKKLEIKGDTGNAFHAKILGRLKQRLNLSQEYISDRYDEWNRVDEHVRLYIDLSRRARLADKSEGSRTAEMPFQRAIVVPLSYAILTTRLAQYMAMFTSRGNLLEIEGRSPDDVKAAKKMEALLSYDLGQTNGILSWYQLVQDAEKYGLGVMYDSWEEEYGWVTERPPTTGIPWQDAVMKALMPPKRQWKKVKEYNSWSAVDPYCYWPDPRVCKNDLQNSEYMGHRIYRGKMYLLERSEKNGGPYFNLDSVDSYVGKASIDLNRLRMAGGLAEYNVRDYADDKDRGFFALDAMQVKIIPKEWELGTSEEPEIWWFTMLEEGLIIRAHRGSYDHNQFTYSVAESNYDSHCLFNPGTIENLDGIQRMMNWSLNCYSDDTEILTEGGWKYFKDLAPADKVATVDPDTGEFHYEIPKNYFTYDYNGAMAHFHAQGTTDILVTPNHNMWVAKKNKPFEMVKAEDVEGQYWLMSDVHHDGGGITEGSLDFDGVPPGRYRGERQRYGDVTIPYSWLSSYLGWFVSEGSCTHGNASGSYTITISQKNPDRVTEIESLMNECPFHVTKGINNTGSTVWIITDKRFYEWIRDNCGQGSINKKVPDMVFCWDKKLLLNFVVAALAGDGNMQCKRENLWKYASASKELADGIQICCIKLGWKAKVQNDRQYYVVNINKRKYNHEICTYKNKSSVDYSGKVYCVENSTHLVIVRRNGKPAVCGQSTIENRMKALNDAIIYGPSFIEEDDLLFPGPAKHVRLTELGERLVRDGKREITSFWQQFAMTDVTAGNLQTFETLFDMAQRMTAASDPLMGQQTKKRVTLGEMNQLAAQGSQRMSLNAKIMDMMALQPLANRSISNRQQFTTLEQYIRITGELAKQVGKTRDIIGARDIQGNFDYIPHSGVVPPDPARMAQTWIQILGVGSKMGEFLLKPGPDGRAIDMREIFNEIARSMGVKNIDQFYHQLPPPIPMPVAGMSAPGQPPGGMPPQRANVQVMPDDQVQRQVQAGNVIPMPGQGMQ